MNWITTLLITLLIASILQFTLDLLTIIKEARKELRDKNFQQEN